MRNRLRRRCQSPCLDPQPGLYYGVAEDDIEGLLARSGLGDRAAFARLYAQVGGKLYGTAYRILGNRSDAEEAVQEAFFKIWHSAGRFQAGRGSALGWLVSIARNQAIDALRARKAPARDISEMFDLADHGPTPEASALGSDDRRRIEGCLGALPRDRALAVQAAYVEGWSYEDLARRSSLRENELTALAHCGALGSLGLTRREALWQAARVSRTTGPLPTNSITPR